MQTDTTLNAEIPTRNSAIFDTFLGLSERVRQFTCGLHGHDPLLHFEADRLSLKCASCQYETPGWELS